MRLNELIDAYYEARAEHDAIDERKKAAYRKMAARENELINAMIEEGIPSISRDDGSNVALRKHVTCSVTKDNFSAIRGWLRDTVGDDSDFVEEAVSKSAITELVKERIADGDIASDFPAFLKVSTRPGLVVRGFNNTTKP